MFKWMLTTNGRIAIATILGLIAGCLNLPFIDIAAQAVSDIFINLLKLVSLPIIFLSIVSTASAMESLSEIKTLGKLVIRYTLLTTIIAAAVALVLSLQSTLCNRISQPLPTLRVVPQQGSYFKYLINSIPSNFRTAFCGKPRHRSAVPSDPSQPFDAVTSRPQQKDIGFLLHQPICGRHENHDVDCETDASGDLLRLSSFS